jgi:hypothetical protein
VAQVELSAAAIEDLDRLIRSHFVLGPWRWMIVVYVYFEADQRVVVVTIQDGRSSRFAS